MLSDKVMKNQPQNLKHTVEPVIYKDAKVLILGTFPSPKSREVGFFYGHPQNRFWKVLAALFDESVPQTVEEKKAFLFRHDIALWDVLDSCTITGASDSSIKDPVPNDIASAIEGTDIKAIFTTGQKAYNLYKKFILDSTHIEAISLPSTSPANCAMNLEKLIDKYKIILEYLK